MKMKAMTEKEFETLLQRVKPVGSLAEKHPDYQFAAVYLIDGHHCVIVAAKTRRPLPPRVVPTQLAPGTKIKLWNKQIIEAH